ncbi:hypothetical protein [Leifsonia sp. Leaf264]|uniref:hypothetical protein n=1 Tax=Leifsonia sp. Leaf264 TaxID=1736314 RepID=UPI0006FF80F8|nr:hypothetical protein [Leifsonia sp. Leaf264]KQO98685.1 hypothetical protein ASF30_11525 [Leifsonia sp. Leaf264]
MADALHTDDELFWAMRDPNTDKALLDLIASDARTRIRVQLAQNVHGPHRQPILAVLEQDPDPRVAAEARRASTVRRFRTG